VGPPSWQNDPGRQGDRAAGNSNALGAALIGTQASVFFPPAENFRGLMWAALDSAVKQDLSGNAQWDWVT